MSDAARIIDKLESRYPCTMPWCGGVAAMTVNRAHYEDEQIVGDRLVYECDTCGTQWYQDGTPTGYRVVKAGDSDD